MDVAILGSGNIATHLAHTLSEYGHHIKQIYSRTSANGQPLADAVSARYISSLALLDRQVDLILIAVSDAAMEAVVKEIPSDTAAIVVHTSGATDIEILKGFKRTGVIYPPQSLNKQIKTDIATIPFAIEGATEPIAQELLIFMQHIAPDSFLCNSRQRLALHVAAVFANNFSNALYNMAYDILEEQKLSFDLLKPIIAETATKVQNHIPRDVQTGPAARNDKNTIKKHLDFLSKNKDLTEIYQNLTSFIIKSGRKQ